MRPPRLAVCVSISLAMSISSAVVARELSFEERVEAQRALERVAYSYLDSTDRPFEEAIPAAVLERKVRTYLKQSAALERLWKLPITAEALHRELERMARSSMMPERLAELHAALDHDPFLLAECLARPALVDRISRNFFAFDRGIHETTRVQAEQIRRRIFDHSIDPRFDHPDRTTYRVTRDASGQPSTGEATDRVLTPTSLERERAELPGRVGEVGPVEERPGAWSFRVVLEETGDELHVARYTVRKATWDAWWPGASADLDPATVHAVPVENFSLPAFENGAAPWQPTSTCVPDDTWDNGSFDDVPVPREGHSATWAGNVMVVWGGGEGGHRYDPVTDTWSRVSTVNAPDGVFGHSAIWTGSRLVVWGGYPAFDTGARYDPLTDTWEPMTTVNAPSPRRDHAAVWTGSEMIVYGGTNAGGTVINSGRGYDPLTDNWSETPISTIGNPFLGSTPHHAVWAGTVMVVLDAGGAGGRYDPDADSWSPVSTVGANNSYSGILWTGSQVLVWNGASGARYDPVSDTWSPVTDVGAPPGANFRTAVWTGDEAIVWGGYDRGFIDTGGRYDPATDSWSPVSTDNVVGRALHTAVWTGDLMVVYGGQISGPETNTGLRYDPVGDSWTPTSVGGLSARYLHSAVWTGSRMVVWGGYDGTFVVTGGQYDPVTDNWTTTTTVDAPPGRQGHTAVWTGSEMLVWGGRDELFTNGVALGDGGRYDPLTDSWAPITVANAPSPRSLHTAVWTGDRLIVWGGEDTNGAYPAGGGAYRPDADTWTPTATAGQPSAREGHTTIWTGERMVVWGGWDGARTKTGGIYDPQADTWVPTSLIDAPTARHRHSAVWTGESMLIWGGTNTTSSSGGLNTGGSLDPVSNTWSDPPTVTDAPSGRQTHTAVWTGQEMVIWGGATGSGAYTGGRYNPATDGWLPTSMIDVPSNNGGYSAVWTGSYLIVWGGAGSSSDVLGNGGRYAIGHEMDDDADGLTECQGDCNDSDPSVRAVPAAIENVRWQSGNVIAWDSDAPNSGSATRYDVLYGAIDDLPSGSAFGVCLADDLAAEQIADPTPSPDEGAGWFLLVRGSNPCGAGSYGSATDGSERVNLACP